MPKASGNIEVIVSLTSFPARYPTLHWTLKSLLLQNMMPNRIVLWVAYEDRHRLPEKVENLKNSGIEIRETDDLRSYKKIIPSLAAFPNAVIVVADDDVYYPRTWFRSLIDGWSGSSRNIVFHRGHKIKFGNKNEILPYNQWEHNITASAQTDIVLPTGVGGVLYPPGSLHSEVTNVELIKTLCPSADDIWLFWMARKNRSVFTKTAKNFPVTMWPSSQEVKLSSENIFLGANDRQIENLVRHFPLSFTDA
jgi:hypothetical protein